MENDTFSTPMRASLAEKRKLEDEFSTNSEFYSPNSRDFDVDIAECIEVKTKKAKAIKTEDDLVPLPDPFPLPKHFKQDVEVALREHKMSTTTRRLFISGVASTMLGLKKYPSRDDYASVARSVVKKYPFLVAPLGSATPHVSICKTRKC